MEAGIVQGIRGYTDDFTAQANESVNYVTAHDNLNLWNKIRGENASLYRDIVDYYALPAAGPARRQVVDSRRADVETLAELSGPVTLPPLSMTVLHN